MTTGYALNIERRYGPGIVRVAAKHLLRELAAELGADSHIDVARIADNFILRGPSTSSGVAALAKSLMAAAGVTKCRKGAVTCLELLFTLPPTAGADPRQYFEQAISWAERYFGVPVLSCVAHADEGPIHAHALLLPLVNGHMVGSDLHGGKAKLTAMQTSFHEAVGAPHGLPKYTPQKRLSAPVRAAAMALARETLQANAALNDDIVDALLAPHAKDPAPLLLALGITMPAPARKAKGSFVDLMIRPVPLEKQSRIGKHNYIRAGEEAQDGPVAAFPESCVGKRLTHSPNPAHAQPLTLATDHQAGATHTFAHQHASLMSVPHLDEQPLPPADQDRHPAGTRPTCPDTASVGGSHQRVAQVDRATCHARESARVSTPTSTGDGSAHNTRQSHPPVGSGNGQRLRRGEQFVSATCAPAPTAANAGSIQGFAEGLMLNDMRARLPALEEVAEVLETSTVGGIAPNGESAARRRSINARVDEPCTCRHGCELRDFSEQYARAREFAQSTGPPRGACYLNR